ncbi:MAG: helicase [Bacteroidia bacterium]|nr:helicase [Bacteroidia bacterium]
MIFNKTQEQEREYLQHVITIVKSVVESADLSVREHVDTLKEYKDYLWSNKDIDPQEIRSMRESILNLHASGESVIFKRARVARILDNPYFGRIDFRRVGGNCKTTPIYIGVHNFYDHKERVNLIYDWRAPVAGIYYEHEIGEAEYDSPEGVVKGEISLKRQYRIRRSCLEFMFESALTIQDDILQKELSTNTDEKMRNIVATIQKEQNRIIRNMDAQVLIIQGVAGSGKTSIALHRIAYLLYAMKGGLKSSDVLIISPNKVFADYISNVLPELGEETVPESSVGEILSGVLNDRYRYQSFIDQTEMLITDPEPAYVERIRYKSSSEFVTQLERFIIFAENDFFNAVDLKLTEHITIPSEYIDAQFRRFNRYPMRARFDAMADYIVEMAYTDCRISVSASDRRKIRQRIKSMFSGNDDIDVYKRFYSRIGSPGMFKLRKDRSMEYSDLAPLAFIHLALEGSISRSKVKHLLIDEMQDYTPIQYKVLQRLFNCRKTILGDMGQALTPYTSSDAGMIKKVFANGVVMKLCKSYRSTYEIAALAGNIKVVADIEPIARHGEKPRIARFADYMEEVTGIAAFINEFKDSSYDSLGIICRSERLAAELKKHLSVYVDDINHISTQSASFSKGVVITSVSMAKGLEFDEVIIPCVNSYNPDSDSGLLYIAVTRAMHRLTLTLTCAKNDLNRCLEGIDITNCNIYNRCCISIT